MTTTAAHIVFPQLPDGTRDFSRRPQLHITTNDPFDRFDPTCRLVRVVSCRVLEVADKAEAMRIARAENIEFC
jgi:hypothetical protein